MLNVMVQNTLIIQMSLIKPVKILTNDDACTK